MFTQPNFFFIGGMRCGSTSLNLMLEQHPDIYMSPVKETYYYVAEALRSMESPSPEDISFLKNYEQTGKYKTNETYQSLFRDVDDEKIVGESSHYIYHPRAAAAIFKHCPDARILVCLRNPVDRFFSEYLYHLRRGTETGCFADYVARYANGYLNGDISDKVLVPKLNKGLQAELLEPWIAQFGRDRVKLVLFDDFNRAPRKTMADVFNWLQIDDRFAVQKIHAQRGGAAKAKWVTKAINSKNGLLKSVKSFLPKHTRVKMRSWVFSKTLERPELEAETHNLLVQFYQDDVEKLSGIVDQDLSAWSQIK